MHDFGLLRDLVVLVAVAIPVVALTQRLRIPSVVGFLLTGVAIGPSGLGLIARADSVSGIAEIGVVLLLFAIGLELPLSRVLRMGRPLVQGGTLQVAGTVGVVALLAAAFGVPWSRALFFGALVSLSSTAVVLKAYQDRGELDAPHGRVAVAILILQDLCVVPLMLLVPLLGGAGGTAGAAAGRILVSLAVLGALVIGGRVALPWLLQKVVATGRFSFSANRTSAAEACPRMTPLPASTTGCAASEIMRAAFSICSGAAPPGWSHCTSSGWPSVFIRATSSGISMCVAPGFSDWASLKALRKASGMMSGMGRLVFHFVTGRNSVTMSRCWCDSLCIRSWPAWAVSATSGARSMLASATPVMRFVAPGPSVARHTPALPVSRPYTSAMNAAPCSWRVMTKRMDEPSKASSRSMFSSPGTPKM